MFGHIIGSKPFENNWIIVVILVMLLIVCTSKLKLSLESGLIFSVCVAMKSSHFYIPTLIRLILEALSITVLVAADFLNILNS